jgi:hypothetical protein
MTREDIIRMAREAGFEQIVGVYKDGTRMAEMPQPSYNVTVVDDAHPNGIPLEQWQNKQVKLTPWRCACGANLYTTPPQRKPLPEEEIGRICDAHWCLRQLARAVERAHGIKGRA